jgi:hypothetical protein
MWVMSNLVSISLEVVLVSVQDRCTVCTNISLEIVLDEANVTPRWCGSCGISFGPFHYGVSIGARLVHGLRQTYHRVRNRFGRTRWYPKLMRLKWKLVSVCLEMVLILTQDRCRFCAERTICLEIILDAADGTPRWRGSCGISFRSIWRWC